MLWAHRLQPAAAWGEISQLQVNGGEGKKRSEVKQHFGVTRPYLKSSNRVLAGPFMVNKGSLLLPAASSSELPCGPSWQHLLLAEVWEATRYL